MARESIEIEVDLPTPACSPAWPRSCARASPVRSRSCRRSTSTTSRLGAVRADHRASRVLPDPLRARDPDRARREIVAAAMPQTLIELGSGAASKSRVLLDAMRDAGSLETYVPVDIAEGITRRVAGELVDEYAGLRSRGSSATTRPTSSASPGPRGRCSRSSEARSATSARPRGARSWRGSRRSCTRGTASCSAPTWSRTRRRSRRPTTTPPASPPSSTRTSSRC